MLTAFLEMLFALRVFLCRMLIYSGLIDTHLAAWRVHTQRPDKYTHSCLIGAHSGLISTHSCLIGAHSDLRSTHNRLISTHSRLISTHIGLISTHSNLRSTHRGLISTHIGLRSTHHRLISTYSGLTKGIKDRLISLIRSILALSPLHWLSHVFHFFAQSCPTGAMTFSLWDSLLVSVTIIEAEIIVLRFRKFCIYTF